MIGSLAVARTLAYLADRDRRREAVAALQREHPRPQEAIRAEVTRLRAIPAGCILGPAHRQELEGAIAQLEAVADWLDQGGYRPVEVRVGGSALREMW